MAHYLSPAVVLYSLFLSFSGILDDSNASDVEVTSARLLEIIESAYPNPLSVSDMAK